MICRTQPKTNPLKWYFISQMNTTHNNCKHCIDGSCLKTHAAINPDEPACSAFEPETAPEEQPAEEVESVAKAKPTKPTRQAPPEYTTHRLVRQGKRDNTEVITHKMLKDLQNQVMGIDKDEEKDIEKDKTGGNGKDQDNVQGKGKGKEELRRPRSLADRYRNARGHFSSYSESIAKLNVVDNIHFHALNTKRDFIVAFKALGGVKELVRFYKRSAANQREFFKLLVRVLAEDPNKQPQAILNDIKIIWEKVDPSTKIIDIDMDKAETREAAEDMEEVKDMEREKGGEQEPEAGSVEYDDR